MNYLSICSGIEAASVAWHGLGWNPVGFSEIEKFPSELLATHYPTVPNFGDMTNYKEWNINEKIDVICGGTPCQSYSISGTRSSLDDERGNLTLVFTQLCDHFNPEVVAWENVPGVLSTKDNAFGCFLAGLAGLDEPVQPTKGTQHHSFGLVTGSKRCVAWRVLDAQYFGVAQRRRRVFVVAFRGSRNWRSASTLFPFSTSLSGDSKPSREAWKNATYGVAKSTGRGGFEEGSIGKTILTASQRFDPETENYVIAITRDVAPTLTTGFGGRGVDGDQIIDGGGIIMKGKAKTEVRRLTPIECERLQGFPDDHTKIAWRGKDPEDCPDGHRYKALGNSWAVPVVKWIGERIDFVRTMELDNNAKRGFSTSID